jgi:SH3-like domain-containing protein
VPDTRTGICTSLIKTYGKEFIIKGETNIPEAKTELLKTLDSLHINLIDSLVILPDTIASKNYLGVATLSVINLRKAPDHSSELVSQAILGTPVVVLKHQNSWVLVQTPDSYISWTEKSSVRLMSRTEMNNWMNARKGIYIDNTGWIADTTANNHGVVGDLVGGSIMEITGETKEHLRVSLPDGRNGFVEKKQVFDFETWKASVQCTKESVCKTAMTYLGIPYLWGGASAKGADCSGFVQSVFFRNGIILPRDADMQALDGETVDISDGYDSLTNGDLLFFGSKKDGSTHITHVALYIGNNDYINAAGRVMINSLDPLKPNYSSARINSLLLAKRIINSETTSWTVPIRKHVLY